MAKKNSDSGASTNLSNFNSIITSVKGIGKDYDPANPDLLVVNLQTVADDALAVQKVYIIADAKYRPAVDSKQSTFEMAGKLFPPIISSLKTAKASAGTIERVKILVDKYRGSVKVAKKEDDTVTNGEGESTPTESNGEPKKERSNRQTSYPFLIQHFEGMYQILSNEPKYAPKKNDAIKLPTLSDTLNQMRSNMLAADEAEAEFSRSRTIQTKLHNDADKGIYALAALVKAAMVEDFGIKSAEYKAISGLAFKRLYDSTANKKKKKKTEADDSSGDAKMKNS